MRAHQTHIILLILSSALSIFLLIAGAKYAEWSHPMLSGQLSTHWLALVFYVGTAPAISLLFTTTNLAAYHFALIPTPPSSTPHPSPMSPKPLSSSSSSPNWAPQTVTTTTFTLLLLTLASAGMWLIQSAFLTACELSPIASGHQGNVPGICPQSHFHDLGDARIPAMLSQLALGKDVMSWIMVFVFLGMAECARRGWMKARVAESESLYGLSMGWRREGEEYEMNNGNGGNGWQGQMKSDWSTKGGEMGVTATVKEVGGQQQQQQQRFELSSMPTWKSYETRGTRDSEIAAARAAAGPTRVRHPGDLDRFVAPARKKGAVAVNLDVGMGYESRV